MTQLKEQKKKKFEASKTHSPISGHRLRSGTSLIKFNRQIQILNLLMQHRQKLPGASKKLLLTLLIFSCRLTTNHTTPWHSTMGDKTSQSACWRMRKSQYWLFFVSFFFDISILADRLVLKEPTRRLECIEDARCFERWNLKDIHQENTNSLTALIWSY